MQEAIRAIQQTALAHDFEISQRWQVTAQFAWESVQKVISHGDLFAEKQMIRLDIVTDHLNATAHQWLQSYLAQPYPDVILLITANRLLAKEQRARWYQLIEQQGVLVLCQPLRENRLVVWCKEQLRCLGVHLEPEALRLLLEATQGNLLALQQEMQKLQVSHSGQSITEAELIQCITPQFRFDVFQLIDMVLTGQVHKIPTVLACLQAEGIEPAIILWVIAREVRQIVGIVEQINQGQPFNQAVLRYKVPAKRQPLLRKTIQQWSKPEHWYALLQQAAQVDWIIKGAIPGNVWQALQTLCLNIASGQKVGMNFTSIYI